METTAIETDGCGYLFKTAKETVDWPELPNTQKSIYLLYNRQVWIGDRDDAPVPVRTELSHRELEELAEKE